MKEDRKVKTKKILKRNSKKNTDKVVASPEKRVASFSLVEMIIVVVIVSLVVSLLSGYLVFKNYGYISTQTSINGESPELDEFIEIYNEIKEKYVEDIDESKLMNSAIDGMLNYLDVYTDYLDEETTNSLQERLDGEYEGIGVEISQNTDGNVVIVTVFPDTPALKSGLKVGDIISEVAGVSMLGKTSSEVASTIKGTTLSKIELKYIRDGETYTTTIDISNVTIPSVEYKVLENNIGYVNISTFSNTTYKQLKNALEELEEKNISSLIIDLRNNSGGYLESAKNICDLFLPKGKVMYQLKYKDGTIKKYVSEDSYNTDYPIAVLINNGSASASEILASALKESYGATLIGNKSFGKGTVQETETLSNGSMIKYTTAYWLTPNGNTINEVGIEPDVIVNNTEGKDEQLEKAKEVLK